MHHLLLLFLLCLTAPTFAQDCRVNANLSRGEDVADGPGRAVWWLEPTPVLRLQGRSVHRYYLDRPVVVDETTTLAFDFREDGPRRGTHFVRLELEGCAVDSIPITAPTAAAVPEWTAYRLSLVDLGYYPGQLLESVVLALHSPRGARWGDGGAGWWRSVRVLEGTCAPKTAAPVCPTASITDPAPAPSPLYPNPTRGPIAGLTGAWSIYDAAGRFLTSGTTDETTLAGLPAGLYYVRRPGRTDRVVKH